MPRTVLVVDDDPAFRDLATRLLTDWGFQVVGAAGSAAEAAQQAARLQPDAALVDVVLPDGNGFDLTARLVVSPGSIRVGLISSDSDPAFTSAAHRAGARGFIPKDELTNAVLHVLMEGC
jgi:DNA-binding NarL/FixJ family response regulator